MDIEEPRCVEVLGAEVGPEARDGELLCGCYVLASRVRDRDHPLVQATPVQEVRTCLRWMEVRMLEEDMGLLEIRFYNSHQLGAHVLDVMTWGEVPEDSVAEVLGHVVCFRDQELRGGYVKANEVPEGSVVEVLGHVVCFR